MALERSGASREESRVVTELPLALGLGIGVSDEDLQAALTLVCESKTAADKIEDALEKSDWLAADVFDKPAQESWPKICSRCRCPWLPPTRLDLLIDHGMRALESRTLRTRNQVRCLRRPRAKFPKLGVSRAHRHPRHRNDSAGIAPRSTNGGQRNASRPVGLRSPRKGPGRQAPGVPRCCRPNRGSVR